MLLILSVAASAPAVDNGPHEPEVSVHLRFEPADFRPLDPDDRDEASRKPDARSSAAIEPPAADADDPEKADGAPDPDEAADVAVPDEAEGAEDPQGAFSYENCAAARDAGAAPILEGEPGFGPHLDGDNDGIGCEAEGAEVPQGFSYENCAAARDAGAAPILEGEPGFGPHLDGDNDGIGCERSPAPVPESAATAEADPFAYENCDAARDAGAAPINEGEPGFGTHLDRDGDGIGCESGD